ncbi:MAG: serine protease [Anaerolineae bacterium]|nr:serine protease [Anaerolineae bacterium]MCO5189218.1 serine protease [Anaerolineae bacterium]MCO5192029.1 serine protease [Anaerolineae bacterium]MCO5199424.1 serine protease [Anaerolineae bacterium]MCO5206057.1 serine protease [Anaerolineae bacterium]
MDISGQVYADFLAALLDAFSRSEFDRMLLAKMDERLENIANDGDFRTQVDQVLRWVDRYDLELKFLQGAREANPTNAKLYAFSQQYNFTSTNIADGELETLLTRSRSMLNVSLWRERLGAIEVQTCQIKIDGKAAGSGFLVGKQAIMTNYHVVKPVLDGSYQPNQIEVVFDYKVVNDDGHEVTLPGTSFALVDGDEWNLCFSPYSDYDTNPASTVDPDDQHLDFALLKLALPVGDMPVGEKTYNPFSDEPRRGWVESDPSKMRVAPEMSANDTVFVFQHPKGAPLSLDFDTIESINNAGTRIRYKANTEGGSSGSGCYDRNFNLIALHHLGARKHNQGIPIVPIRRYIEQKGQLAALG